MTENNVRVLELISLEDDVIRRLFQALELCAREDWDMVTVTAGPVRLATLERGALNGVVRRRPDVGIQLYRNLAQGLGDKLKRADQALT